MISAKQLVAQDLADNIAKPAGWSCSPLLLKFVQAGPETGGGGGFLLQAEASEMKLAAPGAKEPPDSSFSQGKSPPDAPTTHKFSTEKHCNDFLEQDLAVYPLGRKWPIQKRPRPSESTENFGRPDFFPHPNFFSSCCGM